MIAALLIRLVAADRQETALLLLSNDFSASLYTSERNTLLEAEKVAAIPGDASCFTKLVCRIAGKPFVVDEFKTGEMIETGRVTQTEMSEAVAVHKIRWIPTALAQPNTSISAWLRNGR